MNRWAHAGSLATAVVLGAGLVSGISWAAASSGSSTPAASSTAGGTSATAGHRRLGAGERALLRRLEHGQLTVRTKNGDETVNLQEGAVTAVSPTSLTVRSTDGFTATYTLTSGTKVRAAGKKATVSAIADGAKVLVLADGSTAQRVFDPKG